MDGKNRQSFARFFSIFTFIFTPRCGSFCCEHGTARPGQLVRFGDVFEKRQVRFEKSNKEGVMCFCVKDTWDDSWLSQR